MNATAVIDTADWELAVPLVTTDGSPLDFSGTRLSAVIRPIRGGPIIDTVTSDNGTLTFVPAVGGVPAHFAINAWVENRTWRVSRATMVRADVMRQPDPSNLARVKWLGRIDLLINPGSDSPAIGGDGAQSPVLLDVQPYDGRIVTAPMVVGPQGPSGLPPAPSDAATKAYTLALIAGVPTWV